ncbi:hypothetical protein BKA56DRAFT_682145 [Ilyonectria sp. MPI-CAGE-AT-0026]|nr:hypothetical protein BKA56DRAFT_682145 [Ilyonectria sp. MPI-CAGE-AT-0026]
MFVEQLESIADCVLAQCKRARSDGFQSIDDEMILKVLDDFTTRCEAIANAIAPETRHDITRSLSPRWKNILDALFDLLKPHLATTAPTTAIPTTTVPITTTPTTTSPTANAPTAKTSTATASTAAAPTVNPPHRIPRKSTKSKKGKKGKKEDLITINPLILSNLETWTNSPWEFFDQDPISPRKGLCAYVVELDKSNALYPARLRYAKRQLWLYKKAWLHTSTEEFIKLLERHGLFLDANTFSRWIRQGKTYDLFVEHWGDGALLATDITITDAEQFPLTDDEPRKAELIKQELRGISNHEATCKAAGTALSKYLSNIPFLDNFVLDSAITQQTTRKRRPSQNLTHQDHPPFRIDGTLAEFAPQPEHVSSPVATEIGDIAETTLVTTKYMFKF